MKVQFCTATFTKRLLLLVARPLRINVLPAAKDVAFITKKVPFGTALMSSVTTMFAPTVHPMMEVTEAGIVCELVIDWPCIIVA